ncbi:hypothetical protein WDW89_17560 [Deltaproteobacteria bacterium TL4]
MKSMNVKLIASFFLVSILTSSCARLQELTQPFLAPKKVMACASPVIDRAFKYYNEAKTGLVFFFEERDSNRLFQAYYASIDSDRTVESVRKCGDRDLTHYYAMQNLGTQNRILREIIRTNMPDEDRGNLIAIYREQYKNVLKNDFQ